MPNCQMTEVLPAPGVPPIAIECFEIFEDCPPIMVPTEWFPFFEWVEQDCLEVAVGMLGWECECK